MEDNKILKKNNTMKIIIGILFLIGFGSTIENWIFNSDNKTVEKEPVETFEYNKLFVEVYETYLTTDEDTGKVIVNIPIQVKNESDHAFIFQIPHFSYNEDKYVSGIFNSEIEGFDRKIKKGTEQLGTYTITLKTSDISEVSTVNPTINIYDMKSEKEKDFNPTLIINQ